MSRLKTLWDYAEQIQFIPAGGIASTDVQAAIEELDTEKAAAAHTHTLADVTDSGALAALGAGAGVTINGANLDADVQTVFGRTGAVVAATSDYDAIQVDFTPAGGIIATNVQAAIEELDTEKAAASHTHTLADVTDSGNLAPLNAGAGLTINVSALDADVQTVFGRTGAIVAAASDYDANQVDFTPTGSIVATDVQAAIAEVDGDVTSLSSTVTSHTSNTSNPHSVTKTQVGLSNVTNILDNLSAITNPGTTDDTNAGYSVRSFWCNVTTDVVYVCIDATASAAVWIEVGPKAVYG